VSSERAALTWIERCGGKVERRPEGYYHGPGISVKLLGYAFGQPGMPKTPVTDDRLELLAAIEGLDRLELTCTGQITTAGFAALARLPGLRCLDISGLALNAGMLRELAACPTLTELGVRGNDLTPGVLRELAAIPTLRFLDLQKSGITDETLEGVEELSQLTFLMLHGNHEVTDAGVERVGRMTGLEQLDLSSTKVTDGGLGELTGLTRLRTLSLACCRAVEGRWLWALDGLPLEHLSLMLSGVTDNGLRAVAAFAGLKWLDFNYTRVSDAGLRHLHGLAQLETLCLGDTHTSDAATDELRRALPGCKITRMFSPDWQRHWDTFWGPDSPLAEAEDD